jgi:hypothetical protein
MSCLDLSVMQSQGKTSFGKAAHRRGKPEEILAPETDRFAQVVQALEQRH